MPAALLEHLAGQVPGAAEGPGAEIELAGTLLRVGHQLRHARDRQARCDRKRRSVIADERDGREIAKRIVRQSGKQMRIRRYRQRARIEQGVTIWYGPGHGLRADDGRCAGAVLDKHRHTQRGSKPVRQLARMNVTQAAGRRRHDDVNRFAGIGNICACADVANRCATMTSANTTRGIGRSDAVRWRMNIELW